ncbi:MAG: ATP-binding cassette domain-containing protein [Actinomycetota bacterium]
MTWGVERLTVSYGRRVALRNVTLAVHPGRVLAIVGGDGAGKTTLLRSLAGLVRPDDGSVGAPERADLGYMPSSSGVYPDLTSGENLEFAGTAHGMSGTELSERVAELLERTDLMDARDRLGGQLSGGMRQKLGLAMGLLHRPRMLIVDEPSTGIDPLSRRALWRLLREASDAGAAVVLSTTYLDEAERADDAVALHEGEVVVAGAPTEVLENLRRDGHPSRSSPASERGRILAEAETLTKRFGDDLAVDAMDLTIRAGEVVGLIGSNGAGKTTLIRMLLGLLEPTSGRAELFGEPPTRAQRSKVGYVPQGLGLYEDLTVAENLSFAAAAYGRSAVPDESLQEYAHSLVRDLPLGLRRRAAFAAALAHDPNLLVLDEPTSGVDVKARAELWSTIRSVVSEGAGALVTTHHMEEAEECDRILVTSKGRAVASGTLAEIVGDESEGSTPAERFESRIARLLSAEAA